MKMSFLGRDAIVKRMGSEEVNYKLWKLWHLALNRIWKTHTTNRFISEEKKKSQNTPNFCLKSQMDQRERQLRRQDSKKPGGKSQVGQLQKLAEIWARLSSLSPSCLEWQLTKGTDRSNVWCDMAGMETNVHWHTWDLKWEEGVTAWTQCVTALTRVGSKYLVSLKPAGVRGLWICPTCHRVPSIYL